MNTTSAWGRIRRHWPRSMIRNALFLDREVKYYVEPY